MHTLRIPALAFNQGQGALFAFAIDGHRLSEFATISRIRRDGEGDLLGYQRPEIRYHVDAIRRYLESDAPCLPNALVLAFDERVWFEPVRGRPRGNLRPGEGGRFGTLIVPLDPDEPDHMKPAWIVDGQQRITALQEADPERLERPFPVCVVAFIAATEAEQREQFILVNATKPLPKSLIYELLPVVEGPLPPFLDARRFPAYLLDRLNRDVDSPLYLRVKTPTNPDGDINGNSILRMLEHSLSDGVLYHFRGDTDQTDDREGMLEILKSYWSAVAGVFPEAWALPPKRSRLTHGAGIVSMGYLMDAISDQLQAQRSWSYEAFCRELEWVKPHCHWISGTWSFGVEQMRRWNELQNVSSDIHLLTYYLLTKYKMASETGDPTVNGRALLSAG